MKHKVNEGLSVAGFETSSKTSATGNALVVIVSSGDKARGRSLPLDICQSRLELLYGFNRALANPKQTWDNTDDASRDLTKRKEG